MVNEGEGLKERHKKKNTERIENKRRGEVIKKTFDGQKVDKHQPLFFAI